MKCKFLSFRLDLFNWIGHAYVLENLIPNYSKPNDIYIARKNAEVSHFFIRAHQFGKETQN